MQGAQHGAGVRSQGPVGELASRFARPDPRFGPAPIWWWSGAPLERTRLRWQMEQLIAGGVRQAVVLCLAPTGPLYGSCADDPPLFSERWWDIFVGVCEDAAELGFRLWVYDQLGFSGANFQGQLTTEHREWAGHELGLRVGADDRGVGTSQPDGGPVGPRCPPGAVPLAAWTATGDHTRRSAIGADGTVLSERPGLQHLCYVQRRGFDYFNPVACAALIDRVLGEFGRRAGAWFGPVIVGLFQDELPDLPSWGEGFADSFCERYGYDLSERVHWLWGGDGTEAERVRRDYHAHRAALAREAFFVPYARWAAEAGLVSGFDQQTPAREGDPRGGVALYGDYLATHAGYSAPGSDHWGDPKLHSSLAHAGGHERTWVEAFHSSGWGGTLEETWDWLGPFLLRGANLYNPHAVYYATVGGWWEWAAPSTCWRQPYWPHYGVFADAVARTCGVAALGSLVAGTVLVYPTVTAQAGQALAGSRPGAVRSAEAYHELNGSTCWFDQHPGALDRAGTSYEVLDDAQLVAGSLSGSQWVAAGGRFANIVLPALTAVTGTLARMLVSFARAGGRVVSVGPLPERVIGPRPDQVDDPDGALRELARLAIVVDSPAQVPGALVSHDEPRADVPVMARRHGDAMVLLLMAHDHLTGTVMPSVPGTTNRDRFEGTFSWERYWTALREQGYSFTPVHERVAQVRVPGAGPVRAQQWCPRSGRRAELAVARGPQGEALLEVPFGDGPLSVVVLAPELPEADRAWPAAHARALALEGPWEIEARPHLDNRWGDFAEQGRDLLSAVQVWGFEHATGEELPAEGWVPVTATFGPYVQVRPAQPECAGPLGPMDSSWEEGAFSLSRGMFKDPLHHQTLGPKGMVPEEFLAWEDAPPGTWVAARAVLPLRLQGTDMPPRQLVVGANALRRVFLDGRELAVVGEGYWTSSALPAEEGDRELEIWFRSESERQVTGHWRAPHAVRASFAVVTGLDRYARPEWLQPADGVVAGTFVTFRKVVGADGPGHGAVVQVATEGPALVLLNGTEIGRQGGFDPYSSNRAVRIQPYDLGPYLRTGPNELEVQLTDLGRPVAVLVDGGRSLTGTAGFTTGPGWSCRRDDDEVGTALRREQWLDPRYVCLEARPHPLPRASWLDPATASAGVVEDVVPAVRRRRRTEWLRFTCPPGTVELQVPSELPVTVLTGHHEVALIDGRARLEEPVAAGTQVLLRFEADGGHSGGALLSGPVEARTVRVTGPLGDWRDLGLGAMAGTVSYRARFELDELDLGAGGALDLGEVRGTAGVHVNGAPAGVLTWAPYRLDISSWLHPGSNEVEVTVSNTLAGYLDAVSPTPAVARGQDRAGLFGPVVLRLSPSTTGPREGGS